MLMVKGRLLLEPVKRSACQRMVAAGEEWQIANSE